MSRNYEDRNNASFRKYRRRRNLFIIEIVVLLLVCAGGFVYFQMNTQLDKIDIETLDEEQVIVNQEAETDPVLKGYTNIALFGTDSREGISAAANTDAILIASINNDTKVVKLVSIYRDTYLNIGNDRYRKANSAYANGGPEQAITMLNTNLDMDIRSYLTVDFNAMVDIVDALGGIEITVDDEECIHLNNYCVETSQVTGAEYENLPGAGTYLMNGVQAVSYTRIRFTAGNDFKRTERQREVIAKIIDKARRADLSTLNEVMDKVFPKIKTNITKSEIISMGLGMLSYEMGETVGFPFTRRTSSDRASNEVPITLESNVEQLHEFLFENERYIPSRTVLERSARIIDLTGYDENTSASDENYRATGEDLVGNNSSAEREVETETQEW